MCTFTTVTAGLALLTRIQRGWPVRLRVILLVVYLIEPMRKPMGNTRGISRYMQSVLNHAHCLAFCRSNVWFKDPLSLMKCLVVSVYICTSRLRQTNTNLWYLPGLPSHILQSHSQAYPTTVSKSAYYKNIDSLYYQTTTSFHFLLARPTHYLIPITRPSTLAVVGRKRWLSD